MESNRQATIQEQLKDLIIKNLKRVYDPEINLNIYDLGLIYDVSVSEEGDANIIMTLTSPNCPAAGILPMEVEFAARSVTGINYVKVTLTFSPPWNPDIHVSEEAKYQLGLL